LIAPAPGRKATRVNGTLGYVLRRVVKACRVMSIGEWMETKGQKRAKPGDSTSHMNRLQKSALMSDYQEGPRLCILHWDDFECMVYAPVGGPTLDEIAAVYLAHAIKTEAREAGIDISAHGCGVACGVRR
jgi:hypothetical protein